MEELTINTVANIANFDLKTIFINLVFSLVCGFWLTFCYQKNHRGLSYSQSFVHTILLTSILTALVVMAIGSSLTRAFALVGAMSIIRYRTVLKDSKDLTYIFSALVLGMASGTSNYTLAIVGALFFGLMTFVLTQSNYGTFFKNDFILSFNFSKNMDSKSYLDLFDKFCRINNLVNIESLGNKYNKITFEIKLIDDADSENLLNELSKIKGVSNLFLVASKNDIDF
jgi:hypothetical protein